MENLVAGRFVNRPYRESPPAHALSRLRRRGDLPGRPLFHRRAVENGDLLRVFTLLSAPVFQSLLLQSIAMSQHKAVATMAGDNITLEL